MPIKKYMFHLDGKDIQVSESNIEKYGMDAYAKDRPDATIRMRDNQGRDYDVPVGRYQQMVDHGLHPFVTTYYDNKEEEAMDASSEKTDSVAYMTAPVATGTVVSEQKPAVSPEPLSVEEKPRTITGGVGTQEEADSLFEANRKAWEERKKLKKETVKSQITGRDTTVSSIPVEQPTKAADDTIQVSQEPVAEKPLPQGKPVASVQQSEPKETVEWNHGTKSYFDWMNELEHEWGGTPLEYPETRGEKMIREGAASGNAENAAVDKIWNTELKGVVDGLIEDGKKEGKAKRDQFNQVIYPEGGMSLAGTAMGVMGQREYAKATDAKHVIDGVQKYLAEKNGAATASDGNGEANQLQEKLMQKVYDYLVQQHTPKSTAEYILRNVFSGSIMGQILSMADGKSYEQRQIEAGGLAQYQPSAGEEIGAMAASIGADLPVMAVTGAVGGLAGNTLLKGATNRLMASGLSEAAARGIATRAAQQTGMKWALRATSEAVNFGTLEAVGSMIGQAYQTGDVDLGKAATAMAKGAATGVVMGLFGVSNDKFRGMMEGGLGETAGRVLGYSTSLGGRTAILTGSSVFGQYLEDPNFDINNVDWTKEIAHAGLMNLGFDVLGAVKKYQEYKKTGIRMRDIEKLNLTKEDIEQLNQAGISGKDAQEIAESILQTKDANELKRDVPEGKGIVPTDFGFVSQELGVSKEGSVLGQLLSNENIDLATKAKVAYLMTGMQFRLAPNTNVSDVQEQTDGSFTVEKFNPSGQTNETRRFKTREEAEKYRHDAQNEIMPNQVSVLEGMMDNAGKMSTATRIFDMVAKMYNTGKEQIAEAYAKGKKGVEMTEAEAKAFKTIDDLLRSIQDSEDYRFSTKQLKSRMEESYGQQSGWMDKVLKKKYNTLNETERRAYDEYAANMKMILQGNQGERVQIGNAGESFEGIEQPLLGGPSISEPGVENATQELSATEQTITRKDIARSKGAALYEEHDPVRMRQAVVRKNLAYNRLWNSVDGVLSTEDFADLVYGDSQTRESILSTLDENQRRLAEDYLDNLDLVVGLEEAMDAAHDQEVDAAEALVQKMTSPNGMVVTVALGKNGSRTHEYGVVVSGMDSNGRPTSPEGQIIVVPIESVNWTPDFSSFDESKAISMNIKDAGGDISSINPDVITETMLGEYQADADLLEGPKIAVGQQVVLGDSEGNSVNAQIVGNALDGGWLVLEEGQTEPTSVSKAELAEMMFEAEVYPIQQEYAEIDKAYELEQQNLKRQAEREQREQERQEERAAQKAREAEEAARIAEEMKKPINRLAKYPEGHKNAGKPDYERSKPEDVREYLVESLGVESAVKTIRNMRASLEKQVAEQSDKVERIIVESESNEYFPDEAIAAQELIRSEQEKLKGLNKSLDFWTNMEAITAGPSEVKMQLAVTRSVGQQKAVKTKKETYKPSEEYVKMQQDMAGSDALDVLNDLEPHTPEELAAQLISGGVRLMKADETVGGALLKGVKSMSGYGQSDLQRLNFIFASRENGGVSVAEFGEMLELAAKEYGVRFGGKTQEEGVNALLSMLGDVEKMGDITRYVERNRMRAAQKMYDEEMAYMEQMQEAAAQEEYGMSYEEYLKLQDAITSLVEIRQNYTNKYWESDAYVDFINNFAKPSITDNGQEGNDNAGIVGSGEEAGSDVAGRNGRAVGGNQEPAGSVRPTAEMAAGREQGAQASQPAAEIRATDGNGNDVPVSSGQGIENNEGRTKVTAEQIEQAKQLTKGVIEEVKKEIQGRPVYAVGSLEDIEKYKKIGVGGQTLADMIEGFHAANEIASYIYDLDGIIVWAHKAAEYGVSKRKLKASIYHENVHALLHGNRYTTEEFQAFAEQIRRAFPDIAEYVDKVYGHKPESIQAEEVVTRYVEELVDSRLEEDMLAGGLRIEGDTDAIGEELDHIVNLLKDRKYEREGRRIGSDKSGVYGETESGNGGTGNLERTQDGQEKQESVHSMERQGNDGDSEGSGMAGSGLGSGSRLHEQAYERVGDSGRTGRSGQTDTAPSRKDGYQVEKRHHDQRDKDIYAVKFTERFDREKFLELKDKAKEFGGYYSRFGKGGFIFNTEADAKAFAESVVGVEAESSADIAQARAEVNTNPTEAQKKAGNYKMGHLKLDGYDITIEIPKGSVRSGKDANGKEWHTTMHNDYGYIRGTKAVDGDHIDVFLSDKPEEGRVFVVDQTNQDGSFDESKVMYGFNSLEEAREAYLSNYDAGWESRIMAITEVSKEEFKKWIDSSTRKTKAFSEYKSVKAEEKPDFDFDSIEELKNASRTVQKVVKESSIRAYNNALVKIPVAQFGVPEEDIVRMTYDKFLEEFRAIEPYFAKKAEPYLPAVYEYIYNRLGVLGKARMEKLNSKAAMPKEGSFLKNNIAGGDAVAVVRGVGEQGYLVAYAPGMEEAEAGFFMGEQLVPTATMEKIMQNGDMTLIEKAEKPKEYHGGDLVFSIKHGENKHIVAAMHGGSEVKYLFTDGTSAMAGEVEDAKPASNKETELKPTYDEQGRETIESQAGHSRSKAEELGKQIEAGSVEDAPAERGGRGTSGNRPAESNRGSEAQSVNGFRHGEKVLYNGKEATITDFDNGMPVLDTGMAPVIYEIGRWQDVQKLPSSMEQVNSMAEARTPEKQLERVEQRQKRNQPKRAKQKEQMANLFGKAEALDEALDRQEQEIDAQLALLGEYKAGPKAQVREDMHTGAAKTLEKAARKFAKGLAAKIGGHVDGKDISHGLANIAPVGGDMTVRIWTDDAETMGVYLNISFNTEPDTRDFDKLVPNGGYWRTISDKDKFGINSRNRFFDTDNIKGLESGVTMTKVGDEMLSELNRMAKVLEPIERNEESEFNKEVLTPKPESDERRNPAQNQGMGREARQEAGGSEPTGIPGSGNGHHVSDTQGSGRVSERDSEQPVNESVKRNTNNWSYGNEHLELPSGEIGKLKGNIEAIRTLKELEASGQPATPEQKQALLKFVGWGGLAEALNSAEYAAWQSRMKHYGWSESLSSTPWGRKWGKHYEELRPLMTDEEWATAQASTLNSHYTPETVIRGLWEALEYMGFKGGSIQEPAMGVGHILGFMPKSISERSTISGFELDSIPGRIAKQLYPDANITVAGYETVFRPGTKDAIVTNVPFGQTAPVDPALDKTLRRKIGAAYNLHNYFIIKGLLELKPGGVGAFVTSSATMDGRSTKAREYIAGMGVDLIGAIRLPNNTFKSNAGTEVTADILFFRKRLPGEQSNGIAFASLMQIGTGSYKGKDKKGNDVMLEAPLLVNEYFAEHPEMMLGTVMTAHDAGSGGLYGGDNLTLVARPGTELSAELADAIGRLPENALAKGTVSETTATQKEATGKKNGTLSVKDGKVYVASNGELTEVAAGSFKHNGKTRSYADATTDYQAMKETLKELIQAEQTQQEDPADLRKKLNEQYDSFVEKYGRLNENKNLNVVLEEDAERFLPQALEKVETVTNPTTGRRTKVVSKGTGILTQRVSQPLTEPDKAESLGDAIGISQAYRGRMDVDYIGNMLGISADDARERILNERQAYEDPVTGDLVDRDAYLSGNIREKLETARTAAETDGRFETNVSDLEKAMPESIPFVDIHYKLGTPWIPTDVYERFAQEVLGIKNMRVRYIPEIDQFVLDGGYVDDHVKASNFKTTRRETYDLMEDAINLRKPTIMKKVWINGEERSVKDEAATQEAISAIMDMGDAFVQFIQEAKDLHTRLSVVYNDRYNNYRLREYREPAFVGADGKVHYPNSNMGIDLREHQVKAVQRCLQGGCTLLAHQVGTGKTFTMITAAMEMRRLGLAKKPMIVVQNATLQDFASDFMKLYPSAKILVPNETERSASQRKRLFNLIATGDFDAIIVPQSFLAFIPDDEGRKKALIKARVDEILAAADALSETDKRLADRLKKEAKNLELSLSEDEPKKGKGKRVKDQAKKEEQALVREIRKFDRRTDDVLTFEQMGVDALFIDEAHNYKKIGFSTKMQNVKGVDTGYSERANSLYLKVTYVQEKTGGRNVVLATGTPITNTMAEVWTMMRFVAPEILEDYNIRTFDEFAATFGQVEPSLEQNSTGGFKISDRFKSYVNVPELVKAFRSHADVVLTSDVKEFKESKNIPKLKDGQMTNHVIQKSDKLQEVMDVLISALAEDEKKSGKEKTPGLPLVVFSKAKQAAIDLRLINPEYPDDPDSKTNKVVSEVMRIYKESTPDKGIQMVFCDSYQSPASEPAIDLFDYDPNVPQFNLYRDIKQKLVDAGIPKEEIVIVSEITNAERKKAVFEKARAGAVRVLIGGTEKMGVGVNVQDRMIALHHMDAPIRPMDFEQRNGRILRQGNMFAGMDKPVEVLTYGVEGTLDATAYERLRIKQDFINQMMKGDVSGRVMEESDDEDPSGKTFSQMAAELSGDKTLQLLFVAENDVKKLEGLRRSHELKKAEAKAEAVIFEGRIAVNKKELKQAEKTGEEIAKRFPDGITKLTINGRPVTEKLGKALSDMLETYEERYALNRSTVFPRVELNNKDGLLVFGHNEGKLNYTLYVDDVQMNEPKDINTYAGAWVSVNNTLANAGRRAAEIKQRIASDEARLKGAESLLTKEFDKMDELKAARQEVKKLKEELAKKAEPSVPSADELKLAKKNLKEAGKPVSLQEEKAGDSEESLDRMETAMKTFEEVAVNAPEMVVAMGASDILKAMPGIGTLQFAQIVKEANRPEVQAMYVPWTRQIVMLPTHGTVKEMRNKRWHESFHFAIDMALPKGDAGMLMMERAASEADKLAPSLSKWVEDTYGERTVSEEKVVHLLEDVLSYMEDNGKVKSIRGGLDFGSQYPVLNEIANKVINYLTNNGNGKESNDYSEYDEGDKQPGRSENQVWRNEKDFSVVRDESAEGREEEQIVARAKADGTYMKAPNGKPTNLNEKQWVQVRTKAFKKWFGDWENIFKKNFLLNGSPVSKLTGNEFSKTPGKTLTQQVSEYFDTIGNEATSPYLGKVVLDEKSAEDSFAHGVGRIKAIAYASVKDVIEKGIPIDFDANHKDRGYDSHVFAAPIMIGDDRYLCYVTITRKNDSNRFYLHEVWTEKNLANVGSNAVQGQPSHLQGVAKILQNIVSASDNVSKVVDGNGEPMILYHGSPEQFTEFDISKFGRSDQGSYGKAFYFTSRKERAARYGENVMPVFINARNLIDGIKNEALGFAFGSPTVEDARSRLFDPEDNSMSKEEKEYAAELITEDLIEEAKKYDGVDGSTSRTLFEELTVANPNQIKSATDNVGTFDERSNDIRFALRGKPRRKAGESLISYNRRLKEWQTEADEAKRTRAVENMDVENPLDTELNDLTMEMMNHPSPVRKQGESDADFNARQQEWSEWYNTRRPEVERRIAEIKVLLENEKAAARKKEMERTEDPLYTGEVPPQKDDEGQLSDEEMREVREIFQEKLADMKISVDKDQIKRDIKQEIIERRRYIETSNLEDTFFVDKVKKVAGSKEVLKAIPDYIEGTYTGEVSTELVEASKLVSDWFEEVYNLMAMEGVLYDAPQIQNYVTHIWDWKRTPKEAQERYTNWVNTMRLRSPFTKHRVIPSYKEGIAMGMVPKYDDITGILLEYGHYATETIANKRMIEFLRNFKVMVPGGKDNLPMEMDIIVPDKVKDPMYSRMNHTALDGYKVLTQIKPMITPVFGNQRIIDPSHLTPLANKLIDGIWATSGLMKKFRLSFSFFHHGALTETAIAMMKPHHAAKVIAKNLIWDVITKGDIPAMNDKEAARDAVKHLVSLGASNDYVTADVNNLTTKLHQFLKDKNVHVAKEAAYVLDFLNKGSDKLLWDTIHDGFKIASFAKMAKEIRAKAEREGWTHDELEKSLDEAGHLVNDTFGGLHFDLISIPVFYPNGVSPSGVRWMRAFLLSPDWTLATIRQALSPLGYGKLYGEEGFWKTIFGGEKPVQMRKKYGRAFWMTAAIFFCALMNGLNAYFRAADEEEEKKKADEMRKIDPSYKSPYELAYPDGMKWYDYTMLGNTLSHQTHLFTGRYEDGTETYARWGKQFRELPELFFGRDGFSFPGPMIDKMAGKANPLLSTTFEFISGHSLSGWENQYMKDKKGWERDLGRLHLLTHSFDPYSMPTQEDKEWYWLDLIMPSSKGFTPGKAINYFEKGIESGDMNYVAAVYRACVMNGVNPEQTWGVAKARKEAEAKANMLEGVETVQDAMKMFDEATDLKERKRLLRYIEQQTGAQDYRAISQEEMLQMAKDVINGEDVKVESSDFYIENATSEDIMEDYRMKKVAAGLKKYHQDYTELMMENPEAGRRMLNEKRKFIEGYAVTNRYRGAINKIKKAMKDGRIEADRGMKEIRNLRKEFFKTMDDFELK